MIAVAPSHRAGLLGPIARLLLLSAWGWSPQPLPAAEPHQYAFESIAVPAATADEPRRKSVSTTLAIDHLE